MNIVFYPFARCPIGPRILLRMFSCDRRQIESALTYFCLCVAIKTNDRSNTISKRKQKLGEISRTAHSWGEPSLLKHSDTFPPLFTHSLYVLRHLLNDLTSSIHAFDFCFTDDDILSQNSIFPFYFPLHTHTALSSSDLPRLYRCYRLYRETVKPWNLFGVIIII